MNVYSVVDEFEKAVAEYAGAKYGVAVNSCTNAIMLSAVYRRIKGVKISDNKVILPKYTYVGVPYALINAGYKIEFQNIVWKGLYHIICDIPRKNPLLENIPKRGTFGVIDSARRFTRNMYIENTLHCLSFHETKTLPIGDGGMILTDDKQAYKALRQMRFDGRTPGLSVFDDDFTLPAFHCHMKPDVATRGLMLMAGMKDYNKDLPGDYPDLSQYKIFQEGY